MFAANSTSVLSSRQLGGVLSSQNGKLCNRTFPKFRTARELRVMSCKDQQSTSSKGLGVLEWTGSVIPQGLLVKGAKAGWRAAWLTFMRELAPQDKEGGFARPSYAFDAKIGDPTFPVESGRYHLYVGNACPWCHRVLLALALTGLGRHISFTQVIADPERASRGGWVFDGADPVFGVKDLREVYDLLSPGYRGRCTAPLLVDKKSRKIVSNESSLIVRCFGRLRMEGGTGVDLYPKDLRPEIDRWNDRVYHAVNNGVYRCGFATSQAAYDAAQQQLFSTLDEIECILDDQRFLCGERFTEADLRLFPTICRFDAMYATLFKCCRRRVADYPNLRGWAADVHQINLPGNSLQVQDCFDLDAARYSYFDSLFPLNPGGIIPSGPTAADLGFDRSPGVDSGRGPRDTLEDVFHMRPASSAITGAVA